RKQRDLETVGGIPDAEHVTRAEETSQLRFELRQVALFDESAPATHIAEDVNELFFGRGKERGVVKEGYGPNCGCDWHGSYSMVANEMYGSHSRRRKRRRFNPSVSTAACVSPGQMGLSNSSKATMAPLGILGSK